MDRIGGRSIDWLQVEAITFAGILQSFFRLHGLTVVTRWPIDHVAVKTCDGEDYERFVTAMLPFCQSMSVIAMDDRRLATAELIKPISIGSLGLCQCLEIMEPRPEKVGQDLVGFEHGEFFRDDLEKAAATLTDRGIAFSRYANPNHRAIVVRLNEMGQEVKFTDGHLLEIARGQVTRQEAMVVK